MRRWIFPVLILALSFQLKAGSELSPAFRVLAAVEETPPASSENERATDRGESSKGTWREVKEVLDFPLFEVNKTKVNGMGLIQLLALLIGAWWLSKTLRGMLRRFGDRQNAVSKTSLYTVERIIHYAILTAGILMGLGTLGLNFTKLAVFASAVGVGLGFGLQTIFSNFVAGLIVLFEKSLNIGDYIELQSGVTGEVKEINMRSTLITTNDNIDILVPNSEFVTTQVTNWTLREAFRRIHVPFGVAYGTDKDLVRKAVLESALRVPGILTKSEKRKPQVWLTNFGDSSLDFELVVWLTPEAVKSPGAIHAEILWEIETDLRRYDIEIPFPQRDLHIRSGLPKPGNGS